MKQVLAAALLIGVPAFADERPVTKPTRDVDIVYVAMAGGQPVQQRTRMTAGGVQVRIDTPSPGVYMLLDSASHRMDMVSDGERGAIEMPFDPARASAVPPEDARYRRLGADTVAGIACTEWATTDSAGHEVAACFTDDGVMLRARAGGTVLVQAAKVAYGRLDPSIFAVPAGYQRTVAPTKR